MWEWRKKRRTDGGSGGRVPVPNSSRELPLETGTRIRRTIDRKGVCQCPCERAVEIDAIPSGNCPADAGSEPGCARPLDQPLRERVARTRRTVRPRGASCYTFDVSRGTPQETGQSHFRKTFSHRGQFNHLVIPLPPPENPFPVYPDFSLISLLGSHFPRPEHLCLYKSRFCERFADLPFPRET